MPISDSELLDIVRRLRSYIATTDNVHYIANASRKLDDISLSTDIVELLSDIQKTNMRIIKLLRKIESDKQYRAMLKKYNQINDGD